MSRPPKPRARPVAAGIGPFVAVLLIALAVVSVRELAVDRGWSTGSSWVTAVVDAADGTEASTLIAVLGGVVALLGLLVVVLTLRPGRVTHRATSEHPEVWLSPGAEGALASELADTQAGVVSVSAEPRRRSVRLSVVARNDAKAVERDVRAALDARPLTGRRVALRVSEVAS